MHDLCGKENVEVLFYNEINKRKQRAYFAIHHGVDILKLQIAVKLHLYIYFFMKAWGITEFAPALLPHANH